MDIQIILSACVPFMCFFSLLPFVFRISTELNSTSRMLYAAGLGLFFSVLFWVNTCASFSLTTVDMVIGGVYVVCIYSLLILLFLFGVFSIFEASLTLRFLLEIAGVNNGVSKHELIAHYGVVKIIQRRLERMKASSDIVQSGNTYTLSGKQSYFSIREHLLSVFWYIFP